MKTVELTWFYRANNIHGVQGGSEQIQAPKQISNAQQWDKSQHERRRSAFTAEKAFAERTLTLPGVVHIQRSRWHHEQKC
jgi:hypothetical protein